MKKIFRKPIFAILIAISLILVVAGGAYAAFAPQNLTGQGTITVNAYNYSYALTDSAFNFGTNTVSTSDGRYVLLTCSVPVNNSGEAYMDGLTLSSITYPTGLTNCNLSVSLSPSVILPGSTGNAIFTLTGTVPNPTDTVSTINLSGLTCSALPSGYVPTFDTTLTSSYGTVTGTLASRFTVPTSGVAGEHHILNIIGTTANPALTDEYHPFKLVSSTADLTTYFHAKGWDSAWVTQIDAQIAGTAPFFYLKSGSLVDGFKKVVFSVDDNLTIDGDYPIGTYIYEGEITDVNGATRTITVTMYVTR